MSKDRINEPRANILIGSMRSMGYTFESAMADIIDNCISAHCKNIHLLFPADPLAEMAVGVIDDGDGMSEPELFEAMRYGSVASEAERLDDDLGRFGLGLKSASLSQCRVLSVVSISEGNENAYTWDYKYIQERGSWVIKEHTRGEISNMPYVEVLREQKQGTMVLWRDFDILSKSSDGQVYETLNEYREKLNNYLGLIFHRYLNSTLNKHINIYINNAKVRGLDPFLESHHKTTTKKEFSIAIEDTLGVERQINVKPYILPYASDLKNKDRELIGGIETLRAKQGFYIYRNKRLIIWGTWFGMKPRAELTKNARIRVDIPNSLDDIWNIDVKKQNASIPKRIQNQLKKTVIDTMETSIKKETYRGRKENTDDIDYIWNRIKDRDGMFSYQINRDSLLYQTVASKMSEKDLDYLTMLANEIEKNIPIHQIYIDKSNAVASNTDEDDKRATDVYNLGITMVDLIKKTGRKTANEAIDDIMKSEPFCRFSTTKAKLVKYFADETK